MTILDARPASNETEAAISVAARSASSAFRRIRLRGADSVCGLGRKHNCLSLRSA